MLFGITLAMGPAIAHLAWNTVVQRVSDPRGATEPNPSVVAVPRFGSFRLRSCYDLEDAPVPARQQGGCDGQSYTASMRIVRSSTASVAHH